jgi:tetratricopeptide (TPR) repeat protein
VKYIVYILFIFFFLAGGGHPAFCTQAGSTLVAQEKTPAGVPEKKTPSPEVLKLYNAGRELYSQGKRDEAAAEYKKAIALDPAFDYAYGSLGYIYLEQGKLDEARTMLEKALSLSPADSFYHSEIAVVYERQGKRKEALQSLEKALELNPDSWLYHYNLGVLKLNEGDRTGARLSFEKALSLCASRSEKKQIMQKLEALKEEPKTEKKNNP